MIYLLEDGDGEESVEEREESALLGLVCQLVEGEGQAWHRGDALRTVYAYPLKLLYILLSIKQLHESLRPPSLRQLQIEPLDLRIYFKQIRELLRKEPAK